MRRIPVHVVGGFLGAGKTTLVRNLVARRQVTERAAVIVNDFGEAGIDAAILGEGMKVTAIPGGCVCCTAPEGLVDALRALLEDITIDRVFIELSGLSRPQDVVDMLLRSDLWARLERQPTLVAVEPSAPLDDPLRHDQLQAAEVIVVTQTDRHPRDRIDAMVQAVGSRWPPPVVLESSLDAIPQALLDGTLAVRSASHHHDHDHAPSTAGFHVRSEILAPGHVFGLDPLLAGLGAAPGIERLKGIFHTDAGWFRVDVANGRLTTAISPWRQDSRWDVIARGEEVLDLVAGIVRNAVPAGRPAGDAIRIVRGTGGVLDLGRVLLATLPGQVRDVSAVVPGRSGEGVWLRDVLAAAEVGGNETIVLVAADGMVTAPVRVDEVGAAVLVFGKSGAPLPTTDGGPYRILASAGSACGNVKALVAIRVIEAG